MTPAQKKTFVHTLYAEPRSGPEIEDMSFAIIDREAPPHRFTPPEWQVVRRMIHTTGDFGIMADVRFSPDAIASGIAALRSGRPIYVDANMIRAGLSLERLRRVCPDYSAGDIICHIAAAEVAAEARGAGLPRSLFAVRRARAALTGGIAAFGNAPVALLELNRMIVEENIKPALVIAMPVGFVHVTESKEELLNLDVPAIVLTGRRGGSPLVVSVIHALGALAEVPPGG